MVNLAPIIHSAETIASGAAGAVNGAFADLESFFGFSVRVLTPNGGARTKGQCNALGTPWWISDHYEAAAGRAAVDIDNQRDFRNINEAAFLYILGMHGLHNVTTGGRPFPREPWHFAIHYLMPAGGIEITIQPAPTEEDEDMLDQLIRGDGTGLVTLADKRTKVPAGNIVYIVPVDASKPITRTWLRYSAVARARTVAIVPQKELDAIPKTVGSIDFDGHTVGADGK